MSTSQACSSTRYLFVETTLAFLFLPPLVGMAMPTLLGSPEQVLTADNIEEITRLGGGNEITFMNVDSATNYGVELQGRSWLSRFFGRSFSRYYIESNVSLIDSSVSLGDAGEQMTSKERPLQGQSPWVINMTLGYENLVAMSKASLLFNMAGERITKVETQGIPDVYEQSVPLVDFVYSKTFYEGDRGDKLKLKIRIKNLLDPEFKTTKGGEVEKLYRKGRGIKATLEYKFAS